MVKTARAVLIFFSLSVSSPSSLPSPHSSSEKSYSSSDSDGESSSLPLQSNQKYTLPPNPPPSSLSFVATRSSSSYNPPPFLLRLTSPPGGGEGTSAKEENVGKEQFSAVAMTVNGGVAVGFLLCFMACSVKKISQGHNPACQCMCIQYQAVQEAVGTRHVNSFFLMKNGSNDVVILK